MMRMRTRISISLGSQIERAYVSTLRRKSVWSVPPRNWRAVPEPVRHWLGYRVFEAANKMAESIAREDGVLGRLDLPPSDGFNLSMTTRLAYQGLLERLKPRSILELGSGVSTLISAAAMARLGSAGNGVVCSIDHDEGWLEVTRASLHRAGLESFVHLIHAPLKEIEVCGRRCTSYSLPVEALCSTAERGFDLCLIDGPPRLVGRGPCLPIVAAHLASDATVLLDDSYRPGEQAAWTTWSHSYPSQLRGSRLLLTDRGMLMGRWSNGRAAISQRDEMQSVATA